MRNYLAFGMVLAFGASALAGGDVLAATQCRDPNGKLVKCPTETSSPLMKCRNIKTKKPAKCGAPNTEAQPAN